MTGIAKHPAVKVVEEADVTGLLLKKCGVK